MACLTDLFQAFPALPLSMLWIQVSRRKLNLAFSHRWAVLWREPTLGDGAVGESMHIALQCVSDRNIFVISKSHVTNSSLLLHSSGTDKSPQFLLWVPNTRCWLCHSMVDKDDRESGKKLKRCDQHHSLALWLVLWPKARIGKGEEEGQIRRRSVRIYIALVFE